MKKARIQIIISLTLVGLCLVGCTKQQVPKKTEASYSNLVAQQEEEEIKTILDEASLNHVDEFISWIQEYNKTVGDQVGLVKEWTDLTTRSQYDEETMADKWDNAHDYAMDSNCRLTVFLLMDQLIKSKGSEDYGSYIMMDVDEIENNDRYKMIREQRDNYISIFDEVSVESAKTEEDYLTAFPKAWENRGVTFSDGIASMISVVMNDPEDDVLFIGHTGILVEYGEELYFIEKLAPTMPYQVTKFLSRKQLSEELLANRNYVAGDEEFNTFVLENNEVLSIEE